jgi:N-acetylmuramoyl-L-alanine amidase
MNRYSDKQRFIYLLDAGHGGLINNEYVTKGKRSPVWEDGSQYFEGVGNRDIRKKLANKLDFLNLDYHFVTNGPLDVDLDDRVRIINSYCDAYNTNNCVLISIHSNGYKESSANGWEVYTTRGHTKSDILATIAYEEMIKKFPKRNFRKDTKDGDVDKEANFYIIANSKCRAILTENFFHTNPHECKKILMTEKGRDDIAQAHLNAILRFEKEIK